jgi:DNA-binding MarR family transcriptional regulator
MGRGMGPDRDQNTRRIDFLLRQIHVETTRRAEDFTEVLYLRTHMRIPPSAFRLVDHLRRNAMRISDLAASLEESIQTTARLVRQLEAKGVIERRPDETDARASIVALGTRGRELLQEMQAQRQIHINACLAGWSDEQLQQLVPQLTQLATDFTREAGFTKRWAEPDEAESADGRG